VYRLDAAVSLPWYIAAERETSQWDSWILWHPIPFFRRAADGGLDSGRPFHLSLSLSLLFFLLLTWITFWCWRGIIYFKFVQKIAKSSASIWVFFLSSLFNLFFFSRE
jgi:hypothetical protein